MKLRSKLERLQQAQVPAEVPAAEQASDASPTATKTERRVIDELRSKMQALLGDAAARPPREPAEPRFEELGMREAENDVGVFLQRREAFRRSQRVGRSTLLDARDTNAEVLALLALDAELASVDFSSALYLDTETTGLGGGAGTYAFLIGLCYFEDGELWFEQLMLSGPEQEAAALSRLSTLVERASALVTFNGKAFDWPLLRGRFVMNRMGQPKAPPHLDLLHVARRIHGARLSRCTLKHVESEVLGFERHGDIEGAEVSSRYGHYLRSGDVGVLLPVVDHNAWDVASMAALVGLYGEPVPELLGEDLAGVARTLRRSRALSQARTVADAAVERGGGAAALRARAEVHKALGDRLLALADFESAEAEAGDPEVRLHLAKLYEHYEKDPEKALDVLRRGTSESEVRAQKRIERLERKLRTREAAATQAQPRTPRPRHRRQALGRGKS